MDEPTSGLDPNQIVEIRDLIKKIGEKKTVILSTHILPEVTATCSRVVIINNGKIVAQGTADELTAGATGKEVIYIKFRGDRGIVRQTLSEYHQVKDIKEYPIIGLLNFENLPDDAVFDEENLELNQQAADECPVNVIEVKKIENKI